MLRDTWAAVDGLTEHRYDLAALLERSVALDEWERVLASLLAPGFFRSNLHTQLAGMLFVADVEQSHRVTLDRQPPGFLDLSFPEALQHMLSRQLITPEEFDDLTDAERFRAFTMARVASGAIRQRALELLTEALEPGGIGIDAFVEAVRQDEIALGFTPAHHGYLQNVYRTATATSYNAGRYRMQTNDPVRAATGYWEYLTAGDNRVRHQHAALHGSVWAMDDPAARIIYPPNGYQCRCVMIAIGADDFTKDQLLLGRDAVDTAVTEGFRASPGEAIDSEAGATAI